MIATSCLESLTSKDMNLRQDQISSPFRYKYPDDQSRTGQQITTQDWMWDDTAKGPGLVNWLGSGKGIFWISGKPGSGKSTAMKNLWENDRSQELLPLYSDSMTVSPPWLRICAFFYDRGTYMQKSLSGVLMKLIYQIIDANRELVDLVSPHGQINHEQPISRQGSAIPATRKYFGDSRPETEQRIFYDWSLGNLKAAFQCIMRQTTTRLNILALIDGLDEYEHEEEERSDQHSDMVTFFHELVSSTSPNVRLKMVVSSRPENTFRDRLGSSDGFSVEKYTRPDIDKYIQCRLGLKLGVSPAGGLIIPRGNMSTDPRIPNLGQSSDNSRGSEHHDAVELMVEIAKRAQGVFLWVKLIVDQLLKEWDKNRFISMLRAKLEELPHGLQELYKHILKRIAKRDPKASFITIELVLRSQRPLSLLELSLMVAFISNLEKHDIARQFSTEVTARMEQGVESRKDLFKDLRRMLQDRCMGLLEVQEIFASTAEDNASPVQEDYTRTVQFLHQTAKEYLNNSKILQTILKVEAKSTLEVQDGSMMFLQFCRQWIDPSNSVRRILKYKAEEEVLLYAPLVEEATTKSSVDLLNQKISSKTKFLYNLDLELRKGDAGEFWPQSHCEEFPNSTSTWKSNFLAFAVMRGMRNYVAERLNQDRLLVNLKPGRPLLHYAVFPRCSPRLVEDLIAHHADIEAVFREKKYKRTALQSIDFHCSDYDDNGEPLLETVKILIDRGADAKSKIYQGGPAKGWVSLVHEIGHMKIHANAKIEMFAILKTAGVKFNNSTGGRSRDTLLESLSRDSGFAEGEVALWLLKNGAKITKTMNKNRAEFGNFPWTSKEHTLSKYFVRHGLLMRTH